MELCRIDSKGLQRRLQGVRSLLAPLLSNDVATGAFYRPRATRIIGSYSGPKPNNEDFRNWRFRTTARMIRGMYFEQWDAVDETQDNWFLKKAYLSLFSFGSLGNEKELVSLHCDPNEANTEPHWLYKRGPHLHVKAAEEPIPHAHIALNLFELDAILTSSDNLLTAFGQSLEMLSDQILSLYT